MDWKALGQQLAGIGLPLLGGALLGPGGASVGALIASSLNIVDATPESIAEVIASSAPAAAGGVNDALYRLRQLETQHEAFLVKAAYDADVMVIQAVNTTMQAESKSEHWAQWGWRPYVGFCFGTAWIGTYFILPLAQQPVPVIPTEAWLAIGAVLGVASWWRGKAKVEAAQ